MCQGHNIATMQCKDQGIEYSLVQHIQMLLIIIQQLVLMFLVGQLCISSNTGSNDVTGAKERSCVGFG